MVKYCVLCDNRDKTASYHKFPKDVQIKTKWLKFCNLDEAILRTSTFLCSNHFTEEDYLLTATNKILKNESIPSIYHIKRKKRSLDDNDKDCKHNKEIAKHKKSECLLNIHEKESCSTTIQHSADNNVNETPENENIRDSREIHYGTDAVLPINVTPPNSPREPRSGYIGDIRTSHLATPRRAKRALNLVKLVIKKQRRKILTLQQKTTRLKNRVKTMKELIDHLKKKDFISENGVDHLMICRTDAVLTESHPNFESCSPSRAETPAASEILASSRNIGEAGDNQTQGSMR